MDTISKKKLSDNNQDNIMVKTATNQFELGTASIIGARETQQDYYQHAYLALAGAKSKGHLVAVVADGVGGAVSGDVASKLASEKFVSTVVEQQSGHSLKTILSTALELSNQSIGTAIDNNTSLAGMATTIVGVVINQTGMVWTSVGDSHLYLIRANKLEKLNKDHSLGALIDDQYRRGEISKEEAENSVYRNVILSCLSGEKIELIDLHAKAKPLQKKDRIIMASDGLDSISNDEILSICIAADSSQSCADKLVAKVDSQNISHQDNATVVVIDCI